MALHVISNASKTSSLSLQWYNKLKKILTPLRHSDEYLLKASMNLQIPLRLSHKIIPVDRDKAILKQPQDLLIHQNSTHNASKLTSHTHTPNTSKSYSHTPYNASKFSPHILSNASNPFSHIYHLQTFLISLLMPINLPYTHTYIHTPPQIWSKAPCLTWVVRNLLQEPHFSQVLWRGHGHGHQLTNGLMEPFIGPIPARRKSVKTLVFAGTEMFLTHMWRTGEMFTCRWRASGLTCRLGASGLTCRLRAGGLTCRLGTGGLTCRLGVSGHIAWSTGCDPVHGGWSPSFQSRSSYTSWSWNIQQLLRCTYELQDTLLYYRTRCHMRHKNRVLHGNRSIKWLNSCENGG